MLGLNHGEAADRAASPSRHRFPGDVTTWELDRQFLWGQSLLVTPVLEPGVDSVTGYVPQGTWYDFYTVRSITAFGWGLGDPCLTLSGLWVGSPG